MPRSCVRSQNVIKYRTVPGSPMLRKHRIECSSSQYDSKYSLFKEQDSWTEKLCLQENPTIKKYLTTFKMNLSSSFIALVKVPNNYISISYRAINYSLRCL